MGVSWGNLACVCVYVKSQLFKAGHSTVTYTRDTRVLWIPGRHQSRHDWTLLCPICTNECVRGEKTRREKERLREIYTSAE